MTKRKKINCNAYFGSGNAVDKTSLLKTAFTNCNTYFPTRVDYLVHNFRMREIAVFRSAFYIQVYIIFE